MSQSPALDNSSHALLITKLPGSGYASPSPLQHVFPAKPSRASPQGAEREGAPARPSCGPQHFPQSGSTSSPAPRPCRQVQHHGQGWGRPGEGGVCLRARQATPGHSPASAATEVRSAWWTPAWNLTFSTTRQTCPGWRSGCACGSQHCPRGPSSPAPLRPRPSTSSPC